MPEPRDKELYNAIKEDIISKYKPSAYRSGMIVRKYKEEYQKKYGNSNSYIGEKNKNKGLARWYNEEWKNQRGEIGYSKKGDIYRPSIRINKDTPITWKELTPEQIKEASKEKERLGRVKRFFK